MFFKKELESIESLCDVKIKDILNDTESDFIPDTLRDLQTLVKLKDAAKQKLQKNECF